jgi:hypothetical protein
VSKVRWWVLLLCLSVVLFFLDYVTPSRVEFPTTLVVPVLVATYFLGFLPGVGFAILLAFGRLLMESSEPTFTPVVGIANTGIHLTVFVLTAVLTHRLKTQQKRVKTLESILPICLYCKNIRTQEGTWEELESYISAHPEGFSHGLCEACQSKHYPEYSA